MGIGGRGLDGAIYVRRARPGGYSITDQSDGFSTDKRFAVTRIYQIPSHKHLLIVGSRTGHIHPDFFCPGHLASAPYFVYE